MRAAGVQVRSFLKVRFPLFTGKVNYRNHRKIVVVDGRVGFVGGMNLANRYVYQSEDAAWRDSHMMVEGRAVHGLQTTFLLDWYFVDRTLLTDMVYFPPIDMQGEAFMQVVTAAPVGVWRSVMQGLVKALAEAKEYCYLQTPYFLPTDSVLLALQTAALSGVDVRLMLPARPDSRMAHWASRSYLQAVLQAGVKVYLYEKGFLHAKVLVSDDKLSVVGSTNIDFRSFEHNFEVNAFVYDEATARHFKALFVEDQRACQQLFLKHWEQRSWKQKVWESVVRLFSPLL